MPYAYRKIQKSISAYTTPGYSTEIIHYYIATDLKKELQSFDEDEQIEAELLDLKTAWKKVSSGEIMDNKTIVGMVLAEKFLQGES